MVFDNLSNYNYHFITKELAGKILKCTCSVPITKEVKGLIKNGKETMKPISYRLQFIKSNLITKFYLSLSNLFNNLAEEIHKIKCKYGHDNETVKRVELNKKIASAALNTQTLKMI